MVQFIYQARDADGLLVSGQGEAQSVSAMQEELSRQGMIPIKVDEAGKGMMSLQRIGSWFDKVKSDELMVFTRQFATLFRAGVSIDTILSTLAKQAMGKVLKEAIKRIRIDVSRGSSLSQALRQHPKVFSDLYVSMIAAGEEAGILEQSLNELVILIEKDERIKQNIKSATLYPKIVMGVIFLAVTVLMIFVIPKFEAFYGHYNAELPLPTQILMGASNFVRHFWWIAASIAVGIVVAYRKYVATNSGRYQVDKLIFMLPVFGDLALKVANARFGHILSALYRSGLSMSRCLDVVARVIGNEAFALDVQLIADDIKRGSSLADSMQQRSYFPPIIVETTAIGEQGGSLDEMLSAVADHYEMEVEHTVKNLATLLEPIMLGGIFAIVAVMALAIFLPIWNMMGVVSGR